MKSMLNIALVAALVSLGCHSKETLNREQKNYDVVQEGSTSGTSTTIGAPGEGSMAQTTPPITGTNADTTTNTVIGGNAGRQNGAATSTAPLMPAPNVAANGAAMPAYPIPPGLARSIGGTNTAGTPSRRTTARATSRPPAARPDAMTSTDPGASSAPASDSSSSRTKDKTTAPSDQPAPAEEPPAEAPPATQTGTFGPR